MPRSRQEAALEELRKALRKVIAYEPAPKDPREPPPPKTRHRVSTKKERRPLPLCPDLSIPDLYKGKGNPPRGYGNLRIKSMS